MQYLAISCKRLGHIYMARKRLLSIEIWEDQNFGSLSFLARLLFIGMITAADDDGYLKADDSYLRSLVFVYDDISSKKVRELVEELISKTPSLHFFTSSKFGYAHFVKWKEYQSLKNDRYHPTTYPLCPKCGTKKDTDMDK